MGMAQLSIVGAKEKHNIISSGLTKGACTLITIILHNRVFCEVKYALLNTAKFLD